MFPSNSGKKYHASFVYLFIYLFIFNMNECYQLFKTDKTALYNRIYTSYYMVKVPAMSFWGISYRKCPQNDEKNVLCDIAFFGLKKGI
jgi:hypothetical protein